MYPIVVLFYISELTIRGRMIRYVATKRQIDGLGDHSYAKLRGRQSPVSSKLEKGHLNDRRFTPLKMKDLVEIESHGKGTIDRNTVAP